ncbi:hypothetical protein D3C83_281540 [compost metagenome]
MVAAEPVQCEDQRRLLVFGDLRGNEHRIGEVFAGILEAVFAQLHAIVDGIGPSPSALSGCFAYRCAGDP